MLIRVETVADYESVRQVNRLAFGEEAEGRLVDALRESGFAEVSLVAEIDGKIVGHIMFSRVKIIWKTGILESLSLAPMAVLPESQRQGIGSALVEAGIEECRMLSYGSIVVLGHPDFYPRFGFSSELATGLICPFGSGEVWMALELVPESLKGVSGTVEYAAPFGMFS